MSKNRAKNPEDIEALARLKSMREMTYMQFIDCLKGLKHAISLIDDRVHREGPEANYSSNSDLLDWSQSIWKHSSALYTIDQIAETIRRKQKAEEEESQGAAKEKTGAKN